MKRSPEDEVEEEQVNGGGKRLKEEQQQLVVVPPVKPQLFYTPLKTGIVYDVRMRYHAKIFTSYFEYIDPHPEDPRRIYRIYKILAEAGLIHDSSLSGTNDLGPLMVKIPIREASSEEILQVHLPEHLAFIQLTETMSRDQLLEETEKGDSIYVNNDLYLLAKLSCGGSIEACKAVVQGKVKNSLAIVRPPGHHAEPNTPGGFCLFSNVAVAAKNILNSFPDSVRRIVVLDWDIHHGNGTQKAFYNDPRVLYISLHRYENGRFYPGTKFGGANMVGEDEGEGFNVNIPWRSPGMHDGDYVYAFNRVIMPIIEQFDPDLCIISSGFDAADGDIIGGCHVTPAGYGYMTHLLKAIGKGKLAVILEGGYNLDSISKSALGVAKVLVGEPPESTISMQPHLETIEVIDEVIKIQLKYWSCLRIGVPSKLFEDVFDLSNQKLINIADPIRAYQAAELCNKHSFTSLPIVPEVSNPSESESTSSLTTTTSSRAATAAAAAASALNSKKSTFTTGTAGHLEDLVLATENVHDCTILVVTIHDPAEVWANVNPINGNIESNTSVVLEHPLIQLMEDLKSEASKSEDLGNEIFGYIDINIPLSGLFTTLSEPKNDSSSKQPMDYNSTIFAQELLLYIWDNYIQYFSNLKKVVFVGFGEAYQAIVHLYGKRPSQDLKGLVKGTVVFLNRTQLKPLVPVMDESMVDWFYQSSVVFTGHYNPCWVTSTGGPIGSRNGTIDSNGTEEGKKPRRKFGRVLRALSDGLWDVITERFNEGIDFILDSVEDFSSSESTS
ncbi:Histone deacetylase hda1 [Scheffersomyces spartinae]|uniref:Histone deacetylase n=1 Tax=Scheffersomyces spartinae TaxID=45513 RepID=A0A9P7V8C1_9ASCO|nr:Histone deacetylase hda1 [Scheffersomyces spartinae]KAG7192918.1 Histone deacetylase hda1 [Scheffersomyces spartinae]